MWNVSSAKFQKNIAEFVFKWLIWKRDVLRNEKKKEWNKKMGLWNCGVCWKLSEKESSKEN